MSLHAFNCKILFPILSDFENFKRYSIEQIYLWKLLTSQKVIQYGLLILQQAITLHQLNYLDKFLKKNVHITTSWCCFKTMHTDWDNTIVLGISGIKIDMPNDAKVSTFTDNNLTHINDDHFEINLVARLLNQIHVLPVLPPGYDYDNLHDNVMDEPTPSTSAGATTSAPPFLFTA